MTPELAICSICGHELTEEQIMESRTVEVKASGKVINLCPRCHEAMGKDVEDDFLEFLLSV
ncbi:MAG: hypothetical protein ACE5HJ_08640 [Thermoplasmata archaeon]